MGRRAGRQLFLLALALALWSTIGRPQWLVLVAAYVAALVIWELPRLREHLHALGGAQLGVLAMLLCLPGITFAFRERAKLVEAEGLVGFREQLHDRARLERTPTIAPPLLSADRPQTFFLHAPAAKRAAVSFGGTAVSQAESLGFGLFRVDYDPRRDGIPTMRDGVVVAKLTIDGDVTERELHAVLPSPHPRWFCRAPSGNAVATTSEETDELIVIGPALRRIPVADGPVDCAFLDDATVAVSHRYSGELWAIDLSGAAQPRTIALHAPLGRMARSPDGSRLVVSVLGPEPALAVVTWPQLAVVARTPLTAAADQLVFGADSETLVIATRSDASLRLLTRDTTGGYREVRAQRLGRPVVTLARSHDGTRLFAATTDYRPGAEPQLGNHFVQDQLLTLDLATLSVSTSVLTARRSERQSKPGDVDQGGSPMGIYARADDRLLVTFAGTEELWRMQPSGAAIEVLNLQEHALYAPHGVSELADGTLVVSSPASGAIGIWPTWQSRPRLLRFAPDDASLRAHDAEALARRLGERGFYETTRSGIACQSCHMHAGSDDAGYNLGDHRLAPTLSVAGLLGTAPYLRDGSYPRLQDLDEVAQTLYRGYLREQPGRRHALEAYIGSLPRAQVSRVRDRSSERRGLTVFRSAGCVRCHTFPAFTNLGLLPMAALFPSAAASFPPNEQLDVPSLLSVASSPPYLNDGRAATLRAVIDDHNPDNLHGDTRNLTEPQRRDLVAFLSSL